MVKVLLMQAYVGCHLLPFLFRFDFYSDDFT
jgi:hypothetical protein